MRAGELDRRVTIEYKTEAPDTSGQPIETWKTLFETWATVRPLRGDERYMSEQTVASADTQFRIRFRADITPLNRINYDGRIYDITGVIELGRTEGLEILGRTRAE